jgi:hypothetical protein
MGLRVSSPNVIATGSCGNQIRTLSVVDSPFALTSMTVPSPDDVSDPERNSLAQFALTLTTLVFVEAQVAVTAMNDKPAVSCCTVMAELTSTLFMAAKLNNSFCVAYATIASVVEELLIKTSPLKLSPKRSTIRIVVEGRPPNRMTSLMF